MDEVLMCGTAPVGQLYKDTKVEATSIAPIEVSPAEASHNVGTHIMYGGIRYKVTSAISIGDTLTIGTNISAENIEDNLNASDIAYDSNNSVKDMLNEKPLDISDKFVLNTTGFSDLNGTVKAFYDRKTKKVWGGISSYTATSVISTSQVYCTVSSPYKPTSQITFIAMVRTNTNSMIPYFGTISTTGEIKQSATNNSMGLYGSFEYYL